jgi:hypothetical protein
VPLLAVFGVGFIEIWFAVPTGLALGLPAPIVWIMTVAGSMTSVTLVAFAGDAPRGWLVRGAAKTGRPRPVGSTGSGSATASRAGVSCRRYS